MPARNLNGKVALVTGGSKGIGRAIALRLARDGAAVAVNYSSSADDAQAVVDEIGKAAGQAFAIHADVSQPEQIEGLFEATLSHFGRLDILVNNAGAQIVKPLADFSEADFDRIFGVNVKGTFFACQQAARRMADGGRIVNISSSLTVMMLPNYSAYVATKGAVEQLSRSLAKELGPRGITVNVVSPGPTDTELFMIGKTEDDKRRFAQLSAFARLGRPEDIAGAVALLAGDDAHWITGQNIRANGGTI